MKKWIDWLKKNSPWIFLLIVPVLNFYLLEWYTHNPFQTMKPYIQGMNLALFDLAALFLFALTGRISRALGIETAFCAIYGLANYFVLEFRGAPIQPWDILSISTAASGSMTIGVVTRRVRSRHRSRSSSRIVLT